MEELKLPPGWVACTLGEIIELHYGKALPAKVRDESGSFAVYGSSGRVGSHTKALVEGPCIIVGRKGTAGAVEFSKGNCWPIDTTYFVRSSEYLHTSFLFYLLRSLRLGELDRSTAIPGLNRDDAYQKKIFLPPLDEQRRIVEKIETLFARLDQGEAELREVQALLARYRQSVLKAAVTGELTADWRAENAHRVEHGRDLLERILQTRREQWQGRGKYKEPAAPDTTGLPELPEGWVWASVDMVARETLIGLVRAASAQNTEGNGVRYIKMDRIDMHGQLDIETEVRIQTSSTEVERYSLRAGDILFNTRNSLELVGKNGLVSKEPHEPTVFNNNLMRIRFIEGILPEFMNYQMCAPSFRKLMERVKRATTSVAAVYGGDLKALPVAIPPVEEQREIFGRLEEKLAQIEAVALWCSTELAHSAALRQSILKDAFAGRLVPQEPDDEPAAALLARIRAAREAEPKKSSRRKARA